MKDNILLFILVIVCNTQAIAEPFSFDNYQLTSTSTRIKGIAETLDDLSCEYFQTPKQSFKFSRALEYSSSATSELLQEISTSISVDVGLDIPLASFKQSIDLHLQSQKKLAKSRKVIETYETHISEEISRLPCFDVSVSILHDSYVTEVKGKKEGLFSDDSIHFQMVKNVDWRFVFNATFDSGCRSCRDRIPDGFEPVMNLDGSQSYVQIKTNDGWLYNLPLYRNDKWEIGTLTRLLPNKVRELLVAKLEQSNDQEGLIAISNLKALTKLNLLE
jgi:hypothetical protein